MKIKPTERLIPRLYEEDLEVGKLPSTLESYLNGEIPTSKSLEQYKAELVEAEKETK